MLSKLSELKLIPGIKSIFATATFKQSSITFAGTMINAVLGGVFYILVARFLGPSSYGLLAVTIAILTLVADIGDLGTDTGLVRFVGEYIDKDKVKAFRFLKLGLEVKLIVSIFVIIAGYFLAPVIAIVIFSKPILTDPLRIAFLGVGSLLLFSFTTHTLQALQKFVSWSAIQVVTNLIRLFIIVVLYYLAKLNIESTLSVYIAMPLLGFVFGLFIIKPNFLNVSGEGKVAKEFIHYNKWIAAFTLIAAIGSRLDTFITARLLSAAQLGIYSAANQIVQIVPQVVAAVGTVVAPKIASMGKLADLVSYLKKIQVMVIGLSILGVLSIPIVVYLIPLLFGPEYIDSIPVFIVLLFAMLVFLISVPVHNAVFYYFSYPRLFLYLSIIHLTTVGVVGWYAISVYGVIGAATVVLLGQIVNLTIPAAWVFRKIRFQQHNQSEK